MGAGAFGQVRLEAVRQAPWWPWSGGLCDAAYLVATVIGLPRIGAALLLGIVVLGQLAMGLLIDTFGWFGATPVPLSPARLIGVAEVFAGVALMSKDQA